MSKDKEARLRVIDLNKFKNWDLDPIVINCIMKALSDPSKTKEILGEVYSKGYVHGYLDDTSHQETYINNLIKE